MNYKIAVVGNPSSIRIYRAIGAKTFTVTSDESAREQTETLFATHLNDEVKTPEYAVVFVEENFYKNFPEDLIDKFGKKALPAIVPVPSPQESDDQFSEKRLRRIVEKAIGSDILG